MIFEHETDVLAWYESEERVLSKGFLETIPWPEVARHELDPKFLPVLVYMRDVEKFTDLYYRELMRTPTGHDPIIRRFMGRWMTEEALHADLLNRFLGEAGYPTTERWYEEAKRRIPTLYHLSSSLTTSLTNLVGKHFSAVHMTWGAINELSTLSGYERLWTLAKHPMLEHLLRGIAREEARHALFYWSIARLKLQGSQFRQRLTRLIVKYFWSPVGQGAKPASDTNYVIAALFQGDEGIRLFDTRVTKRLEQLPGLVGLKATTERIAAAAH